MGIAVALLQSILWAGATVILRVLSTRVNGFVVNGVRAAVAWLVLIPFLLLTGGLADWGLLTPLRLAYILGSVALGGVLGDYLYLVSLKLLGVGRAFPITSSHPVFTVLLGALLLGTPATPQMIAGMALVMFGVYLVARPRRDVIALDNTPPIDRRRLLAGVGVALATAIIWAFGTLILSMGLEGGIDPVLVSAVRIPLVVALSLAAAGQQRQLGSVRRLDRRTWALICAAGILGWAVGSTLYSVALQMIGPGKAALISSTAPIFGVPLSALFLKERPTRNTLIGTVITVAGIVLVV